MQSEREVWVFLTGLAKRLKATIGIIKAYDIVKGEMSK